MRKSLLLFVASILFSASSALALTGAEVAGGYAVAKGVSSSRSFSNITFEIGGGANYWHSLKHIDNDKFDEDGLGWLISSRVMFSKYFGLGLEVERSPKNYIQFEKPVYAPAAYVILGSGLYAACGVGTYFYDGDIQDDIWYALRVGFKIPIIEKLLYLDINANYRAENWSDIKNVEDKIDSDSITLGAALRIAF